MQHTCFAKDTCFTSWESDKENADIIFIGKLYEVHNHVFWDGSIQVSVYNFVLSESYKGLNESNNFISVIAPINGCCTIKYKLDSTYVMFAREGVSTADIYWTNDCYSNAINPNISEVRKYFGTPILHEPELIQLDQISEQTKYVG